MFSLAASRSMLTKWTVTPPVPAVSGFAPAVSGFAPPRMPRTAPNYRKQLPRRSAAATMAGGFSCCAVLRLYLHADVLEEIRRHYATRGDNNSFVGKTHEL